jgi:hypothetical protein
MWKLRAEQILGLAPFGSRLPGFLRGISMHNGRYSATSLQHSKKMQGSESHGDSGRAGAGDAATAMQTVQLFQAPSRRCLSVQRLSLALVSLDFIKGSNISLQVALTP